MFCVNCGAQLPNGAAFCSKCGTKLNTQIPQQNNLMQSPGSVIQYTCGSCGTNLFINSSSEYIACGKCGAQLKNPTYKATVESTPANMGTVIFFYDNPDMSIGNVTVTILENGENVQLENGKNEKKFLEVGIYHISIMISRKRYDYVIHIHSIKTVLLINIRHTMVRNTVDIKYKGGLELDLENLIDYDGYAQTVYSTLLAAGFTNVKMLPVKTKWKKKIGRIDDILIDGIEYGEYSDCASNVSPEVNIIIKYLI